MASKLAKLLLISLDGLGLLQLELLYRHLPWLSRLNNSYHLSLLDSRPLSQPQAIWAELLTGQPWFTTGCPGYARPALSLNQLEIISEANLKAPLKFLDTKNGSGSTLVVNMPLVMPSYKRFWLGDGSLPLNIVVSPEALGKQPPFSSYVCRPYASTASALANITKSIDAVLTAEYQRLECAQELLKIKKNWQTAFLRFTVFDLLSHLLGPDVTYWSKLKVWPNIANFFSYFNKALQGIAASQANAFLCIISGYSHSNCIARVNLNVLLAEYGFCCLKSQKELFADEIYARRIAAIQAINGKSTSRLLPKVCFTDSFHLSKTRVASPVYGSIYLNSKEKFSSGIVDANEIPTLIKNLESALFSYLKKDFGSDKVIWQRNHSHNTVATPSYSPDFMLYIENIEFHQAGSPAIDFVSHPKSTHKAEGLVWVPAGVTLPSIMSLGDLSTVLSTFVLG